MKSFFLACTPRTGSLWFRRMLPGATRGTSVAEHQPKEIDWEGLQPPCVVAMHWHRTPELVNLLNRRNFEVIVTIRHPLDVLTSILHFCHYEPATARWLEGECGDESLLFGADPSSPQFLQYALSQRFTTLLGISGEWHGSARAVVRYEDLVDDTEGTLERVLALLGCDAIEPLVNVIEASSKHRLRPITGHHVWRAEPGLWRQLITPEYAKIIYEYHREVFQLWGYERPQGPPLSVYEARDNWKRLCELDEPRTT